MENLLTVTLEAHYPERNHHRRYEIRIGRDLFGDWTVAIRYGRAGRAGQELRYGGPSADELRVVVRRGLSRRLSAPRRIGCAYRVSGVACAPGFDGSAWVPADVLAGFTAQQAHRTTTLLSVALRSEV